MAAGPRPGGAGVRQPAPSAAADARSVLGDPLPLKATTAMRLAADPLDDAWAQLPNPLAA
ncbi:hypothetical protein ACFQZ4_09660 [Catellatospora coxensis]